MSFPKGQLLLAPEFYYPNVQPRQRVRLNRQHPLINVLNAAYVFNQSTGVPECLGPFTEQPTVSGGVWSMGPKGRFFEHDGTGDSLTLAADSQDLIPTGDMTIVMGYEKSDATNRASAAFSVDSAASSTTRCSILLPYLDGTVYFDYGGDLDEFRLTAGGLTFGDDVWAFTAGSTGLGLWQNGISQASSGTAITRSGVAAGFNLGSSAVIAGDLAQYKFLYIFRRILTEGEITSLSRDRNQLLDVDYVFAPHAAAVGGATVTGQPSTAARGETGLVITGTDFGATQGTGGVTFNGDAVTVTSWADTSITVTMPTTVSSLYDATGYTFIVTADDTTNDASAVVPFTPATGRSYIDLVSPLFADDGYMLFGFNGTPNPVSTDQLEYDTVTPESSIANTPGTDSEWILASMHSVTQTSTCQIIRAATGVRSADWTITWTVAGGPAYSPSAGGSPGAHFKLLRRRGFR